MNAPGGETSEADLDVRRRRALLLVVAAVIAGAGVAYELGLMLLGTVTVGSTERANAVVLGAAMFGMGVGATTGGRLARRPVTAFVGVECLLAVMGAASAPILYWTWASLDAFWGPLLAVAFVLGACIGAEMPLLAALNDRLAEQKAATVVAAFTAADYFGALVGAVAFGFVIRPWLGLVDGTIVVAVVNVAMAAAVAVIVPSRRTGMVVVTVAAASVGLILVAASADRVTDNGRQRLYRDPIVARRESAFQEIIVTRRVHPGGVIDTRLFLDGDLQLSSVDSHRYHESLAHPVISLTSARRVLVLGGGDCVAVREVLRHPSVEHVTLVELDPNMTGLFAKDPAMARLNGGALSSPKLKIVNTDAFQWLQSGTDMFDVIVVDFPDPTNFSIGKLYTNTFYSLLAQRLSASGYAVIQTTSPLVARQSFWTVATTIESVGLRATPYHANVPSFGEWGYIIASHRPWHQPAALPDRLRFLSPQTLPLLFDFPLDMARVPAEVNRLSNQVLVSTYEREWGRVGQ